MSFKLLNNSYINLIIKIKPRKITFTGPES